MKLFALLALTASFGMASASNAYLSNRQDFPDDQQCVQVGEYCCTWEGCADCCSNLLTKCDLSIDAAQGKCVWDI
ncbi:hypothetical protein BO83DRAFT_383522 [Aspergillus eucalypticola CBS 122712]|uniref:Uncharacterized protein n=1 Tax=Aspergillus eucalypticola (strain CBS 122712 / IBT 29274) TaxID=1448314 RepID=A0A317UL58_ASPEC|nr:uncharacterized protein BO83DRAFT_383522 [Aspergillus eucalypticola CBS 122712]PWY62195.1 hypothetical protein BO83DRAFT_383522 [Aspergillus eucalypticola CBS 122712]